MKLTPDGSPATADGQYPDANGVLVQIDAAVGGFATFDIEGPFGTATGKLQHQPPGMTVWRDVTDASFNADGSINVRLSTRKFRLDVAGSTGGESIVAALNN